MAERERKLTPRERDVMLHALGLTRSQESYRNHFCCDGDTDDGQIWEGLVTQGLATVRRQVPGFGGMNLYHVSTAGRSALSQHSDAPATRAEREEQ
jgi:hypothetical protein